MGGAPPGIGRRAVIGGTLLFAVGMGLGLHLRGGGGGAGTTPAEPVATPLPPRRPPPGTVTVADVPAAEAVRIDLPVAEGAMPDVLVAPARPARVAVPDRTVLAHLPPEPATPEPAAPEPAAIGVRPGVKPAAGPAPAPVSATPPRTVPTAPMAGSPPRAPATPRPPLWLANARNVAHPGRRPMVAVVIDDLGLDRDRTARVSALPGPLTLSFMAYAEALPAQARAGRAFGHELMLHMPMQPSSAQVNPGPGALLVGQSAGEIRRRLERALAAFSGYVGLNNHMGSRFTADTAGMHVVMDMARRRELLFLDSRTTGASVAPRLAPAAGVPFLERTVFLDHDPARAAVDRQLTVLERLAVQHGHAIAIGHPRDATIAALAAWIEPARARGLALVPASAVARFARAV
ncbi:divergent polysaccharide deacetylase family protein [Roseospira goensis]|uniref:Divergent polysaccharide deacetylase family protein n=1 Tax=Roseospira goensis TaxID=391922 RepID=A0A7W6RZH6_9PROT|nr:divergent polysaccharide deacetylase family protein [Roseospira goensis]MBB4285459.1 hypothetical protein [Roseospira goensis]